MQRSFWPSKVKASDAKCSNLLKGWQPQAAEVRYCILGTVMQHLYHGRAFVQSEAWQNPQEPCICQVPTVHWEKEQQWNTLHVRDTIKMKHLKIHVRNDNKFKTLLSTWGPDLVVPSCALTGLTQRGGLQALLSSTHLSFSYSTSTTLYKNLIDF